MLSNDAWFQCFATDLSCSVCVVIGMGVCVIGCCDCVCVCVCVCVSQFNLSQEPNPDTAALLGPRQFQVQATALGSAARARPTCHGEHLGTTPTIGHSQVGLAVLAIGAVSNGKTPLGVGSATSARDQSLTSGGQTYPTSPHWD